MLLDFDATLEVVSVLREETSCAGRDVALRGTFGKEEKAMTLALIDMQVELVRCRCGEANVQLYKNSEGRLFAACPGCSVQIAIEYAADAEARLQTISEQYLALRENQVRSLPPPTQLEEFEEMSEAYWCERFYDSR